MPLLTERLAADEPCLWLDYNAYAGALLANGSVPWLDVDALIGWMRKSQSLLKSDVIAVPVATVVEQWLATHPELKAAMAAKRRAVFPLKTLLADAALRNHLVGLAKALRSSFAKPSLLMSLPSPRLWVALASAQAVPGELVEIDADAVDGAAAYVADFLREFAECGLDGILLQESAESEPASVEDLQLYQAVFNVAAHYRWDAGLRLPVATHDAALAAGPAFVVSPRNSAAGAAGVVVGPEFWSGETPPECPAGGFRYAEIPVDAKPESVLDRLAALR